MSSDKYADISNYREKLFPDCTAGSLVAGSQERTDPKKCWDMREALEVVTKDNIKGRDKNPGCMTIFVINNRTSVLNISNFLIIKQIHFYNNLNYSSSTKIVR